MRYGILVSTILILFASAAIAGKGDINNDGLIDIKDAILGLQVCSDLPTSTINKQVDINADQKIGLEEVIYIMQIVSSVRETPVYFMLNVTKAGEGTGTVTSSLEGIDCGSTCTSSFEKGTTVTLTATPLLGFGGWSGACSGKGVCTVAMNSAKSLQATFNIAPLVMASRSLPSATAGTPYAFTLEALGGKQPYRWDGATLSPNDTANGMSIGTSSGVFSGTPVFTGTMPLLVELTDDDGRRKTIQTEYKVTGTGSPRAITNSPPSTATQGTAFNFTFATSWTPTFGCSAGIKVIQGVFPPGLSLNALSGVFSGTPAIAGKYTFTLSAATNQYCIAEPRETNAQTFTIQVNPAVSPASPPGASNWVRNASNPVLVPSSSPAWDDYAVSSPAVVKVGGTYIMYYNGEDKDTHTCRIGRATSTDGVTWTRSADPVLSPGTDGSWDSYEVRYPSVHNDGSTFRMWYWGSNGSCNRIGLATSTDGIAWTKITTPVSLGSCDFGMNYAPGAVIKIGPTYTMWPWNPLGGVRKATSTDGITWTDQGSVLSANDYSILNPSVVQDGDTYRMWFTKTYGYVLVGPTAGFDLYKVNVGYASSVDGVTWTTYPNGDLSNIYSVFVPGPAGVWDRPGIGQVSIMKDGSQFKMWYTGGRINLPVPGYFSFVEGSIGYAVIP